MNLTKSKIFLIFCLAFIVGVFFGRFMNFEIMAMLAMVFVILATVGWNQKAAVVLGVAGLILVGGAARFRTSYAQNDLKEFYGQKAQVVGIITEEPDERPDKTYLTLGHLAVNDKPLESQLLISVGVYPAYEYGQKLSFEAKIQEPKEFPDFSYKNYLSRFGIDAVAYPAQVVASPGNFGNKIKYGILHFKQTFVRGIHTVLPEPQASFLGGLLLGAKHAIPAALTEEFNRTGTSHIVAVSGYNITIIAVSIEALLGLIGLRKRPASILSILLIIIFVIMTGATASVVRAGIMGVLLIVARNTGRMSATANALAFTAAAMLVFNPQILAFDVGFQLSFAALIGIIYIPPLIEHRFLFMPKLIREYFLATLSAQITALPILLLDFGQLSLVAIVVNILVLPAVPFTMLFGFLAGAASLVWVQLGLFMAGAAWILLTYILKVIGWFAALPFAAVPLHLGPLTVAIYYVVLTVILFYWQAARVGFTRSPNLVSGFTNSENSDKINPQKENL